MNLYLIERKLKMEWQRLETIINELKKIKYYLREAIQKRHSLETEYRRLLDLEYRAHDLLKELGDDPTKENLRSTLESEYNERRQKRFEFEEKNEYEKTMEDLLKEIEELDRQDQGFENMLKPYLKILDAWDTYLASQNSHVKSGN